MVAWADEIRGRLADLSELMTVAQQNLATLGEDELYADVRAANLRATIEAVQRELDRAKRH